MNWGNRKEIRLAKYRSWCCGDRGSHSGWWCRPARGYSTPVRKTDKLERNYGMPYYSCDQYSTVPGLDQLKWENDRQTPLKNVRLSPSFPIDQALGQWSNDHKSSKAFNSQAINLQRTEKSLISSQLSKWRPWLTVDFLVTTPGCIYCFLQSW